MKFSWPALEGEIDCQDLLAMEGLRLFDPGAFAWLRDNRDFLFSEGRFILADEKVKEQAIASLKRRISEDVQSQVLRVLSVLFPQSTKWFEGRAFGEEDFIEVTKRRGVGSEAGYDTYFGLHPSSDAIPKAVIDDLMASLESTDDVEKVLRSYLGKKNSRGELMILKLLDELRIQYRGNRPAHPTQGLLDALFRIGEEIIALDWNGDMFQLSPRAQIGFLIRNMLEQWGLEAAGQHLIEAFSKSDSPAFMAEELVSRGQELGVFRSSSTERAVINQEEFQQLAQILLLAIQKAANDGTLTDAPYYFSIIRAWGFAAGNEAPRGWLTSGITRSAAFMAKAARGLVSYSIGTEERRYNARYTGPGVL